MATIRAKLSSVQNVGARLTPKREIIVTNFSTGSVDTAVKKGLLVVDTTLPNQVLDTFPLNELRAAKYIIQATFESNIHFFEMTLMHDDTETYYSEYGTIQTNGDLLSVTTDIDGIGNVRVLVTPLFAPMRISYTRIEVDI